MKRPEGAVSSKKQLKTLIGKELFYVCACGMCQNTKDIDVIKFPLVGIADEYQNGARLVISKNPQVPYSTEIVEFHDTILSSFIFENYWHAYAFKLKVLGGKDE